MDMLYTPMGKDSPFTLTPSLPENYSGHVIGGAETLTAHSDQGRIIIQEFNGEGHRVQYQIARFIRNITLKLKGSNFILRTLLSLKHDIIYHLSGNRNLHLREGQFAIMHGEEKELNANFEKDKTHEIFEAHFSKDIFDQILPAFPKAKFFDHPRPGWAGPDARRVVHEMLEAGYSGKMQQIYFENKVREYLFYLLTQVREPEPEKLKITKEEEQAVRNIRDLITARLDRHLTIPELARAAAMNEFKLKSAFKLIYGMGIFEYLQAERMKHALALLTDTNKPVKEIASLTGFTRITSFITSFRRHYGFTPGSVRRQ